MCMRGMHAKRRNTRARHPVMHLPGLCLLLQGERAVAAQDSDEPQAKVQETHGDKERERGNHTRRHLREGEESRRAKGMACAKTREAEELKRARANK